MLLLRAGNPSAWTGPTGNNTYLFTGARPALIDAGVGEPEHLAAVEQALDGRDLASILITHGHPDHVGGLPALGERWPGARVRNANGDLIGDGEMLPAGDGFLRAIHTPGHSPDHYCFLDESTQDVYSGDLVRIGGSIVIPASKGGDLAAYLDSLRRVRALAPRRLLPAHGPLVEDVAALIDHYLRHRLAREAEILEALRQGCSEPATIVLRVYGAMPALFARAAADSVVAQLVKLRGEGRADETEGVWRAV